MEDIIIALIVAAVLVIAIRSTVAHFRGQSSCCGGSTYKAHPRKLSSIAAKKAFYVEGMNCQNCVNRVTEAIQNIDGVSADVNLRGGRVIVSCEKDMDFSVIPPIIEALGYSVKGDD